MNAPNDAIFLREGPLNKAANWVAPSGIWTRVLWNARQARTIAARWFHRRLWPLLLYETLGMIPPDWRATWEMGCGAWLKNETSEQVWTWERFADGLVGVKLDKPRKLRELRSSCPLLFVCRPFCAIVMVFRANMGIVISQVSIRWVSEHVPTNSINVGLTRGIGQASQSYSSWKWKNASQREEKDERWEDTCVQPDLCHCRYRVIAVHGMNVLPSKQHFYKFLWLSVQWMRWETPNCLD